MNGMVGEQRTPRLLMKIFGEPDLPWLIREHALSHSRPRLERNLQGDIRRGIVNFEKRRLDACIVVVGVVRRIRQLIRSAYVWQGDARSHNADGRIGPEKARKVKRFWRNELIMCTKRASALTAPNSGVADGGQAEGPLLLCCRLFSVVLVQFERTVRARVD